MPELDFRKLEPTGKCPICDINCWAETNNEPAIWPCGLNGCPYPPRKQTRFALSSTGSSLAQITYMG